MAVFMLGALMPVGLWAARNYAAYDRFIMINCAGGISFWKGNNETYAAYGKAGSILGEESAAPARPLWPSQRRSMSKSQRSGRSIADRARTARVQRGLEFVAPRPQRFALLTWKKFSASGAHSLMR